MNQPTPMVSVITLYHYNRAQLPAALASLLCQTRADWECVIIDDGSDDPADLIERTNDRRFRYFRSEVNGGRGAGRAKALSLARGKYICTLDADDWCYPERLELQVKMLEAHPEIGLITTDLAMAEGGTRMAGRRPGMPGALRRILGGRMSLPCAWGPSMFRAGPGREAGFNPSLRSSEDLDFLLRFTRQNRVAGLPRVTYVYNETSAGTLREVLIRHSNRVLVYRGLLASHPVAARYQLLVLSIKRLAHRLLFRFGLNHWFMARRQTVQPSLEDMDEFEAARDRVFAEATRVFGWSPPSRQDAQAQGVRT